MPYGSTKRCGRCQQHLPLDRFYKLSSGYLSGYCKPCTKAKVVEWQKDNPDKKRAQDKKTYAKKKDTPDFKEWKKQKTKNDYWRDPQKSKQKSSAWARANPERVRERSRRYRANNPEVSKSAQAKYHASPEYKRIHADRERLRRGIRREEFISGIPVDKQINIHVWARVCAAFNDACCFCGSQERLTIEHFTPLSRGGDNSLGNVAVACSRCNEHEKNDKTLEEWMPEYADELRRRASLKPAEGEYVPPKRRKP